MIYIIYLVVTALSCIIVAYERPRLRQVISQSAIKPHAHHIQSARVILEPLATLQIALCLWMLLMSLTIPKSKEQILFMIFEFIVYGVTLIFAIFNGHTLLYSMMKINIDTPTSELRIEQRRLKNFITRIVLWTEAKVTVMVLIVIALNSLEAFLSLF